jgi:hypothetical protein
MEGLHLINKDVATKELQMPIPGISNLEDVVKNDYVGYHEQWHEELTDQYSWAEMIAKFREDRKN